MQQQQKRKTAILLIRGGHKNLTVCFFFCSEKKDCQMHKTVACLFQTASKNFAQSGLILFLFFLASKIA